MEFYCILVIHFKKHNPEEYTENREEQNALKKKEREETPGWLSQWSR